jgi:YHS domain-containing protein
MFQGILRLIYFAVWAYFFFIVYRFVRNLWRRIAPPQPKASQRRLSGVMVKDEACLTYVAKEDALREVIDGREYFFCSKECRKKFLGDKKAPG